MKYIVTIIVAIIVTSMMIPFITSDNVTITVTDKEYIVKTDSSKYLIFTETETFENIDCFVKFKFNSSDVYGELKIGETYNVDVYGFRVPFLSMYRNIVRVN